MRINGVVLTMESILRARLKMAENADACIAEVEDGTVKVNDKAAYIQQCRTDKDRWLNGAWDGSLVLQQWALYIQTGDCPALLAERL